MKKKIICFFVLICAILYMFSLGFFVDAASESVVFINADNNAPINEIGDVKNISTKISFTPDQTGYANIITVGYDSNGIKAPAIETVAITTGEELEYTTASYGAEGLKAVKVFAWTSDTLSPLLSKNGVIDKTFSGGADFSQKFNAVSQNTEENPYIIVTDKTVAIDELLESAAEIQNEYFTISAETIDGNADAIITKDANDWTNGTIKFSGTGLVKLTAQDYSFCLPTDCYVRVIEPQDTYDVVFDNTNEYVYRVGNKNKVKLQSLFEATNTTYGIKNTVVTVDNVTGNANGTVAYNASDWALSEITFSGTGIVNVTIKDDYSNPTQLKLEVVDGYNATQYSEMKTSNSVVMLNDISIADGKQYSISNSTLYGNGFTFDVTNGTTAGANLMSNYLVSLKNSILDNVRIIGDVYTEYGATTGVAYNNPVVLSTGNNVIANSYIANCAAPVRVNGGSIEIINSTLKGGNFANIDIRNGEVTLENVTTINQADLNDRAEDGSIVVGLGVAVYYEGVLDSTKVNVKGTLEQYNHLSENDAGYIKDSSAQALFNAMFGYNTLIYTDGNGVDWVNTGILSMTSTVAKNNISAVDGYISETPKFSGKTGYVHTKSPQAPSVAPEYKSAGQYSIAPSYSFDYTAKNYIEKTEGSNRYCYYSDGVVTIAFDNGDTFAWDTSILTVQKLGEILPYTVTINGADYTGKSITFDSSGEYLVEYSYTDSNNYYIGENGEISTYDKTYTKYVQINVNEIMPNAKNAEFKFGSAGTEATTVTIGSDTYVMPNDTTLGYTTVSGTKIYYPTVEMFTSDGAWSHSGVNKWYACFPVFDGAVTITDYAEGGTGAAVVYDSDTTTLPSGLSVPEGPGEVFKYASGTDAPAEPSVYNGVLCYTSPQLDANARSEMNILAKYKYQDNAGATYYYYVNYHCKAVETTEFNPCVTGDTLVTLADGSKKRIDEVTYQDELMVWNFYEGCYDVASPAIIFRHDYADNTIIRLTFDDGTIVKVSNIHQFFDSDANEFVNITADTVGDYLGHNFLKRKGDGYDSVSLTYYEISEEYTKSYGILSSEHYNILVEDIFSMDCEIDDYYIFNYFEHGEDMMFDKEKMASDIEKYGLYSYADFNEYLTHEQFDAFNVKYMKIAVGKGLYTYEGILALIEEYLN